MLSMPEALHHAVEVARATLPIEPEDLSDLKWRLEHTTPRAHQLDRKALLWLGFALWEELTRRQRPHGNAGDVLAILREAEGPDTDQTPLRPSSHGPALTTELSPEESRQFRNEYDGTFASTQKCTVDQLPLVRLIHDLKLAKSPDSQRRVPPRIFQDGEDIGESGFYNLCAEYRICDHETFYDLLPEFTPEKDVPHDPHATPEEASLP